MRDRLTTQSSIILIVDDQPITLKMLFSFLQESGYKVLVAKRGESAIKKLQKVSADLILLDIVLPGMDGFETCQRLKASPETKDIPIIFMTALSESVDKIKGLKLGAVDYITKPFQQEEVLARIENQLKIRKLQRQLEQQNKQLQQEISTRRKIEERLELVIRAAKDGFWDWNLESGEIYISPRCKEMLGYCDQELPNELAVWENLIFPEDKTAALKLVEDYNAGKVSQFESIQRFRHKNGSTVYVLIRTLHLNDANGHVNRLIGASTDITKITTTIEALRQSRRLLAGVLNSSLDGVAAFSALRDSEGNIVDFIWLLLNPAAEKMKGRTESELVGKQMLVEMPGIRETGLFELYVRVVETGESLDTEHYYAYKDKRVWLQIAAVKLGDGFALTWRDITKRKQLEEHNCALLDAIPDIMFRQRVDGTYLDVRSKDEPTIVPSELISRNLHNIPLTVPPVVKQGIFEHLQAAVETGKLQIYEYEIPKSDGIYTYESRCVKSGADEAIRIVRDVTERKRTEVALKESEKQFRGIFENAAIGIGLTGADGRLLKANPTLEAFLGYSEAEMRGKDFANITHPDDRVADLTLTTEVMDGVRDSFQLEKRYIRKDSQIFWGRLTVSAVRNLVGEFQYTVAILEDITDRKKAEERLHLLERAIAASNNAIIVSDAQAPGNPIIYVNSGFERMTGYQKEDVLGSPYCSFLRIGATLTAIEEVRRGLIEGRETQVTLRSSRIDGSLLWNELCITPVRDAQGCLTHFIGVQTDISDRVVAQESLHQSKAALERQIQRVLLLEKITQDIRSSLQPEQIFQTAANQMGQAFRVNRCVIHTYIAKPFPRIPPVAEYREPNYLSMMDLKIPVIGNSHAQLVLSQDQAVASNDVSRDPLLEGISDVMQHLSLKSVVVVRTSYQDKPNGIVCLQQCDRFRVWTAEEIELLEAVAAQMGIALAQANLLAQEKQRRQELDEQNYQLQQEIRERQRAELALQESQRFLEAIADANPSLLYLYDLNEQRNIYTNSKIAAILGYTPKELQDMGAGLVPLLMHPEDQAKFLEVAPKVATAKDGDIVEFEYRMQHKEGSWRWLSSRDTVFARNPDGTPRQVVGTATDISDRKQAEIELAATTATLEKQIQRALLLEQITQEIRSSLNPEQIFQIAATQIGQAFSVNRCLIRTYIDHPTPQIPLVAEFKQAGIESVLDLEIPVIDNPHAQLVLTQDCAIASDNVYTDPLLEATSPLCHQLGLKSMLAVRTSYQGKPNGVIAIHQYDSFRCWHDEEIELLEAVAAQVGIAIAQGNLLEQEKQQREKLAAQNHALEKAKQDAEAANRAKSNFLSKMSHELRTPLNAILGFTRIMAHDKTLSREQFEHLGIINRSGEHLLALINDILSMSKIEAGQITLNENRFDLYQLLDSLEEMLLLNATSKGIKLVFEHTSDLPQYIQTDESKLRQVLINLLGNAIKFTQRGSVTLRVSVTSSHPQRTTDNGQLTILFEVEDTGFGIALEELESIFDPFVQTQMGRRSMEGTGLGLPISQQFVRMMGGDLTVKSTLGQGTIFTFDIQVGLATSADEKPLSSQREVISLELNQSSYRILVVEDVLENRQLLVEMLEFVGFQVQEATNGQEGVALWQSWSPHLICMDIVLPVVDGYEATQQIKQSPNGKDTIIIALTASAFEEQREAILRAGCDDFLPKPFHQEVLLDKIAHHLGVRYVYGEQRSPNSQQSPAHEKLLTPEDLAVMPASWVTQLHQAALYADDALMNQLIEKIPLEHGSLRCTLKEMLDNFCLEQLIDLTELAN